MVAADHMSSVHIPTHAVSLEVSHPFGFYSEVNISARPTNRITYCIAHGQGDNRDLGPDF